ncbi:MAG TPA: 30S ribosome-binding factor RbfA [Bacteroidales bacterium]|nr:30S ribosome-binding factor RbfA [Bacteroidales bacterium]HPS45978.1 30S ribosome-binding factor RbfA [Bacteroidales bacterium]HQH19165.1 30S ribosome-binding factor RbfA [Bacteroidales bacterium]HQI45267.1 30S ribosome-binding factor RbfA [Bacteroidales bacterium]
MDSTRQNKVGRLIQKDLSEIFQQEIRNLLGNTVMITITKVKPAPDLSVAKVYLSIFSGAPIDKKEIVKTINLHTKDFRRNLGNRVKNQLRVIPELEFFLDDSLDYIENIENLLKK